MPFLNDTSTKNMIIEHFKRRKKGFTYEENTFIEIIHSSNSSKNDVYWSVLGLRDVGTEKSIPLLKELINYPMQDVKDCSVITISQIMGSHETEFYISVLEKKGSRKDYAMLAIAESADIRAIEPVIEYLDKVYKKWRQPKCDHAGDAYLEGLMYLSRFLDVLEVNEKITGVFEKYLAIKEKLPEGAVERLKEEVPYFKKYL